jgi:microcystin degradation protein MlrC
MKPRVLVAGLFHETHTFLSEVTRLEDFYVLRGDELLNCAGNGSPLGSAITRGRALGWQIVPTVDYRAQPSGTVADDVFDQFWTDFQTHAKAPLAARVEAVYLVLHGAMVTPTLLDVEGEFLQRLRQLAGAANVPIYGVFDLHANFSARMAQYADCLVAYRENPHRDANAMAVRAVELLDKVLQGGARARTYHRAAPIVWPPTGTSTDDLPMRALEALARQMEAEHPEIDAVNVCAGFSFADTLDTGVSFTIATRGAGNKAQRLLAALADKAWELRAAGNVTDPPVDDVLAQLAAHSSGLTVIAEPSDNIAGGAPGDGTGLLRDFVRHKVQRAAICLCDPAAVQHLQREAIGTTIELAIGGRGSALDEGPLSLDLELVALNDGRFRLEDPHSHLASMFGSEFDMGPCAVVKHAGITILLTSCKTPPFDLGQWRSQGIDPAELSVIGVKAAVAHRQAYAPIAARLWSADTPGPCRSDLRTFAYRQLRRPIYPLDDFD